MKVGAQLKLCIYFPQCDREVKALLLSKFNIIELGLYLSHRFLIFSGIPDYVFSGMSIESYKHCLAILLSGMACNWVKKFNMFVSIASFKESLPRSFLAAMFGQINPTDCLQRKICVFSLMYFPRC